MTMNDAPRIASVSLWTPGVIDVLAAHRRFSMLHCCPETDRSLSFDELQSPGTRILGALLCGSCIGIIALHPLRGLGTEIRSMHVLQSHRGRGLGRRLLGAALTCARNDGVSVLVKETGKSHRLVSAGSLYRSFGFEGYPKFVNQTDESESWFMRLELDRITSVLPRSQEDAV